MVVVVNSQTQQVLVQAPDAAVKVLEAEDTLESSEVVPGWQLPIKEFSKVRREPCLCSSRYTGAFSLLLHNLDDRRQGRVEDPVSSVCKST